MGGGLRKPTAAAAYEPSQHPQGKNAASKEVIPDEQMDLQEELEATRAEEMAQRQKTAVDHVVENLFPYAPVRVQAQRYPPSSPHAGKSYLWITVDEDEIKRRGGVAVSPVRYPVGVAVDADGNVFVSEAGSANCAGKIEGVDSPHTRKISASSIMDLATCNQVPPAPSAPKLVQSTQTSLAVRWKKSVDTTVDRYELQYRLADSPNNPWQILSVALTTRDVALDNVKCNTPFEFRVRAHNPAGWSDYSPVSIVLRTLPGIPDVPRPPVAGALTNSYVSLFWSPVNNNGMSPVTYTLEVRECDDPSNSFVEIYEGTECGFVPSELRPKTTHIFRLRATNAVGSTPFVESRPIRTLAHARPEIVELSPLEQSTTFDRWIQCWDPKTEQVFYFNKYTCQRVKDEPPELAAARADKGLVAVEDTPDMVFRRKRFRFHRDLRQGMQGSALSAPLPLLLRRETMYDDTLAFFQKLKQHELTAKPKISFEDEAGIDSGGLTKDWFLQISKCALDNGRRLFRSCDHGQYEIASNSCQNTNHLQEFQFLGKFIAKSVFDRQSLDLPLCDVVFKHLLQLPITMDDLRTMDAQYHKSLVWMLENEIADVIDETFSVEVEFGNGKIKTEDLKENGRDIPVTDLNKQEYVELILKWRTEFGVKAQLDALLQGMSSLIPLASLRVFALDEFRMLVNGKPTIDVEELRANTVFQGGYSEHSHVVLWLWQALREFSLEMRGQFLKFMTGTNKVPLDGFEPPLNLTKSDLDPQALPRTHTCFNQLVLPEYASYQTLVEKITFAVTNAEGFELS